MRYFFLFLLTLFSQHISAGTLTGRVVNADGQPVADATVFMAIAGDTAVNSVTWVSEGIVTNSVRDNSRFDRTEFTTQSDRRGRFEFDHPERGFVLFVSHDQGWNEVTPTELDASPDIVLRPWSKVEGEMYVAGSEAVERDYYLSHWNGFDAEGERTEERGWFRFRYILGGTTSEKGKFQNNKVVPGEYDGGIKIKAGTKITVHTVPVANRSTPLVINEGEEQIIYPGLHGQTVTGKLKLPDGFDKENSRIDIHIYPHTAYMQRPESGRMHCGMPYVRSDGYLFYFKQEESKAFRLHEHDLDPNKPFVFDNIPTENYVLRVLVRNKQNEIILNAEEYFNIQPWFEDKVREKINLGELEFTTDEFHYQIIEFIDQYVSGEGTN